MNAMGHLTIILGCMFAQKTTELMRWIHRYRSIGYEVLVVNSHRDTRYSSEKGEIVTHDEKREEARMLCTLAEVDKEVRSGRFRAVAVDEGQFFPDLFSHVSRWADEVEGLHVAVAGLDGTFQREPFGDMLRLLPHAEEVMRLSALCSVCRDGTKAIYSRKKGAVGAVGAVGEEVLCVGASETYEPVCRRHYHMV